MAISADTIKTMSAQLYDRSLRGIPADAKAALHSADQTERNETARHTLRIMLESAEAAERSQHFVCSDAGVPVFFVKVGTQAHFEGNVRQAITDGFAERDSGDPVIPSDYSITNTSERVVNLMLGTARLSNGWAGIRQNALT